jgi:hypothetical protein
MQSMRKNNGMRKNFGRAPRKSFAQFDRLLASLSARRWWLWRGDGGATPTVLQANPQHRGADTAGDIAQCLWRPPA